MPNREHTDAKALDKGSVIGAVGIGLWGPSLVAITGDPLAALTMLLAEAVGALLMLMAQIRPRALLEGKDNGHD